VALRVRCEKNMFDLLMVEVMPQEIGRSTSSQPTTQ